jgi:hypothetical protein
MTPHHAGCRINLSHGFYLSTGTSLLNNKQRFEGLARPRGLSLPVLSVAGDPISDLGPLQRLTPLQTLHCSGMVSRRTSGTLHTWAS